MKQILAAFLCMGMMASCGGGDSKDSGSAEMSDGTADNPVYQKGLSLVAKSDCLTCHKVEEKLTGPAYREVAKKYASMPDTIITHLANKIRSGGNGVWGEALMTPHPAVSLEDAEAMVKYIMLLKK